MQVSIPHEFEKEEVRRRLKGSSHKIADQIPGGMAQVTTDWPSEDCMTMQIAMMGQHLSGLVEIAERQVIFSIDLPPALSFVEPIVESTIRQKGEKLLSPPA